jgi:hypothetical protein
MNNQIQLISKLISGARRPVRAGGVASFFSLSSQRFSSCVQAPALPSRGRRNLDLPFPSTVAATTTMPSWVTTFAKPRPGSAL